MQKDSQEDLDLEYVQFNVSRVLTLLNKRFARKKGWWTNDERTNDILERKRNFSFWVGGETTGTFASSTLRCILPGRDSEWMDGWMDAGGVVSNESPGRTRTEIMLLARSPLFFSWELFSGLLAYPFAFWLFFFALRFLSSTCYSCPLTSCLLLCVRYIHPFLKPLWPVRLTPLPDTIFPRLAGLLLWNRRRKKRLLLMFSVLFFLSFVALWFQC